MPGVQARFRDAERKRLHVRPWLFDQVTAFPPMKRNGPQESIFMMSHNMLRLQANWRNIEDNLLIILFYIDDYR
ncbi:hypothetical protein ASD46_24610 [Rhizobium sp. Root491]|nr:hypothetical protein ASD46_24610 [Rhizobium sp. Root491]